MFKFFKKRENQNNVVVENKLESIFPEANELAETMQKKWRHVTAKEILEAMNREAGKGNRYARIHDSYISDELVAELEAKGYTVYVNVSSTAVGPYFEIRW